MTFVPYCSERGIVDLAQADAAWREGMEQKLIHIRKITVRWVPCLQMLAQKRPEMHWCAYDDGRVVAFIDLERDETFADLEDIYNFISSHVRHLASLGNYKGPYVSEPSPEDEIDIHWRVWNFKAGNSELHLNCGFGISKHCKIVVDGVETITKEKKRVVCGADLIAA